MYNKYLKTSSTNPISICPSDAQISNSSALTFDLVKMEFKSHESSAPLIKLGDLDKWVEENPNKYRKLKDEDKRTAQQGLADNNGSSSDGYKWDRLTGESLFLLSERLSDISSLSFGPVEPVSSYTPVSNYIAKSKYDVRIGIRPWDISKNEKTDSCKRHKSKAIHPIFVRPRSVYDKPENSDKSKLGYKLASSLSGLPEANIRHDLGFKLFVEVEERKVVSSYDPIRCRAEKVFSYSQRYVTARNKTIVKTTSVTTTTPPVSSFQANLASNKNNNKLVSSKANNNKLVSNNLVNNLANKANKANSKHNPSTISLSSVSNSEADSSGSSSTSTTTTTLQCTTNSDNSTTCKFKLEGRVWDRGYRCPDGNDDNDEKYCLNSSFSKGVFLCRLNKKISGIDYPVGDWFLCDDLSGSSFTIGDDTHPVTASLYASNPEDGDRSKDKELHLRFTELPAPDSSIEYSIELRLVDEYGNYSPSPQEDALIFSTTTTTDPCADVTCTGIQRCNSATGRCECPANHASCRNNAICCNPGNICVNNGCACDDTACGLLGKVCSADTSLADRCVNQQTQQTCEQKRGGDNCKTCLGQGDYANPVTKTCPSGQTLNTSTSTCVCEATDTTPDPPGTPNPPCIPASCPSGWSTGAPCSGGSSQQVTGGCNDTITCYTGGTAHCTADTNNCMVCPSDGCGSPTSKCTGGKVCNGSGRCVDPPPTCNKSCSNCSGTCDSCDSCTGTCTSGSTCGSRKGTCEVCTDDNSCTEQPRRKNLACSNCSGTCDSCDTCTGTCTSGSTCGSRKGTCEECTDDDSCSEQPRRKNLTCSNCSGTCDSCDTCTGTCTSGSTCGSRKGTCEECTDDDSCSEQPRRKNLTCSNCSGTCDSCDTCTGTCTSGSTCGSRKGTCEECTDDDSCSEQPRRKNLTCSNCSGTCDSCDTCTGTCTSGSTCGSRKGTCEECTDDNSCNEQPRDKTCPTNHTCNPSTGRCKEKRTNPSCWIRIEGSSFCKWPSEPEYDVQDGFCYNSGCSGPGGWRNTYIRNDVRCSSGNGGLLSCNKTDCCDD